MANDAKDMTESYARTRAKLVNGLMTAGEDGGNLPKRLVNSSLIHVVVNPQQLWGVEVRDRKKQTSSGTKKEQTQGEYTRRKGYRQGDYH